MKKLNMLLISAALMALLVPAAWAQMGAVKGTVKGIDGKPYVGASVVLVDKASGRKFTLKADKNGNIFNLGVGIGTYNVSVLNPEGKEIYSFTNFPVQSGNDNTLDIDLQKEAQRQQGQMSEEQKQAQEKQNAEHLKIGKLNDMLKAAKAASDAGNYDEAKNILQQAVAVDQTHEVLFFNLAEAQRNAAIKAADPAAKKSGLEESVENYKKALAITPATKPDIMGAINNQMGDAYAKMGNVEEASKAYDAAATSDPTNASKYYFNEGAVLTNSGKPDAANTAFDKAIQADPTRAEAYYQKGLNLLNKATNKPDGTIVAPEGTADAFNKYLELAPTGPNAENAKQMLAAMGSKIETSFGKSKTASTKKK